MNIYLIVIVGAMIVRYLVSLVADILNLSSISPDLPQEFDGWYDNAKYAKSQQYLRDTTRFGILQDSFSTIFMLGFVLAGGFNFADKIARNAFGSGHGDIVNGLFFMGLLMFGSQILSLPFSWYSTFVIEERYGFNRTSYKTFFVDIIKGWALILVLGAPLLALVLFLFEKTGNLAWLWCWGSVTLIQILMMFVAPYIIMPLFNKFSPLEDGELRSAVEDYARKQSFAMRGVFTMDGSKRSSRSNAFFTGFGSSRRIVLFDTLIQKHSVPELLAIVAHEMGHYKLHHIRKMILQSIAVMGLSFFLMSLCIGNTKLFEAFGMEHVSIYAALVFFGFLYTPVSMLLGIVSNAVSRKHEFEADAFAVQTIDDKSAMIDGLKRLTVENLGNLKPHPFEVILNYSHPPILRRIAAINQKTSS
jgi:STE24 endopeptidase